MNTLILKLLATSIFYLINVPFIFGQGVDSTIILEKNTEPKIWTHKLLQEADSFFCIRDTLKAISKLEEFIQKRKEAVLYFGNENCGLISGVSPASFNADVCILISELYAKINKLDKSFQYLELASSKPFLWVSSCGIGILTLKAKLSMYYADYFVRIGNLEKAINCLLECFLLDVQGNDLTLKLKFLLERKYTKKQIKSEIFKGISQMKLQKDSVEIVFFNKKIFTPKIQNLATTKRYYKEFRRIELLTNTPLQYQKMQNIKVLQSLKSNGDKLIKTRNVFHWTKFKTNDERTKFIADVKEQNFEIESDFENKKTEYPYIVVIKRKDKVDLDSVNKYTTQLCKLVLKYKGEYDAWETSVEKE